ncbi:hypothetical protein VE04_08748 [Pseudogymnoascus sp. 24MN13]|nr:hypothetical protein VE04_08748 [Pseudogymnoascus sp. 24MN13]
MANRTMYTRVYSTRSDRQLVSGRGPNGDPLSRAALLGEFWNHANYWNREPTALVSCSDRIIDTLRRAFGMHYGDGEPSADIWIAFIEVPPTTDGAATRIHLAKTLAKRCKLKEPNLFLHEVVFEWAIPRNYVVHEVSLKTLIGRGLQEHYFIQLVTLKVPRTCKVRRTRKVRSTLEARQHTAKQLHHHDPYKTGITLGLFARKFGARAPLNWISHQLFYDCVWTKIVSDDVVRINFAHEKRAETVDFRFFRALDDGIKTSLCDWWLSDIDFLDYENFKGCRDETEDAIAWELIELWETWFEVDGDGTVIEPWLSAVDQFWYDREKNNLLAKHERMRAPIEAEAVRMSL